MGPLGVVLGESAPIMAVREQVGRLLRSATGPARRLPPILVLGETGTGKGLLAATVHRSGPRAAGPFVDVNCSAIPETLLEAELFGFERGAFTDARQPKAGLFQAANGGTMFLDEVGLLPLGMQAKLLKVIEERSVRRLGSTRNEALDVAIVAATSEDLPVAVSAGRFRADLYHRLSVVTLTLPPLRERGGDIVLLAEHFLASVCADYGVPVKMLSDDARAALLAYPWPGNVRELGNVMERAVLLNDTPVLTAAELALPATPGASVVTRATHSPALAASTSVAAPVDTVADADERRVLLEALESEGWNFTRAATRLNVPRNTLRYRAERLGLSGRPERRRGGRPQVVRETAPSAPPAAAATPSLERRRLTFLEVRLCADGSPGSEWRMRRALDATAEKLRRFGGQIEEATSDAVVAIFGLEPDEDAPRRAAHAAIAVQKLGMRARRGDPLLPEMMAALHTAPLTVVLAADRVELDPVGRQEARRLLQAALDSATPEMIVATEAASRFLGRRFDLARLEGKSGSPAWQVIRSAEPGRTRFVGREHELRLLFERFELAHAGRGQIVTLMGEPGVGKSRLLHEFRRRLGASAMWIEGQALSFGRAMAFHPVVDMVKRAFRIDDGDPDAVMVQKIERAVRRLGDDLDHVPPFLRYLLSLDPGDPSVLTMDPKVRHAQILRSTHLLFERGAEMRPHVLALEDVHWADPATEDWITRLAGSIAGRRALILVTTRPGYRTPFGDLSFHTTLALSTLSNADTLRMAVDLIGAAKLPADLQALIIDKADGNPFFVEELVRSLHELGALRHDGDQVALRTGVDRVLVPDTVEEIILARLDRLDEGVKELLKVAAVIGRHAPVPLLRALTQRSEESLAVDLGALQDAEFLYETRSFPELEYTFKHALTQDVAYASLTPEQRRRLHAGVVEAMERVYVGRLGEHVERLAYHALRGELWRRAVGYSRDAGTKAFDRSANREAVASLEQALVALGHLPQSRATLEEAIDIRLVLRSALLQLGEIRRMTESLREAEALATAAGDRRRLAWVWALMGICQLFSGEPREAAVVGQRAFALAEEVGDVTLRATARTPWGHACRELGDFRRAIELLRGTIEALSGDLARQRLGQGMPPALYARNVAALCLAELGEFREAVALGTESADIAQALDVPFGAGLARIALGHTYLVQGKLEDATRVLEAAGALIEARDTPTWFPWTAAARGYVLALSGRPTEAVALLQNAIDRAMALPFLFGHSQWLAWLAHAHLLNGNVADAVRLGEEALKHSRERGERGYEAWALHILGDITAAVDAPDTGRAETFQDQALALARELGMRPLVARCERSLADLARRRGDARRADELLTHANALFRELDMPLPPETT
jgi:DNA-binding NtrC family response regulator/tetratricopeptide (TPR) repeat protein